MVVLSVYHHESQQNNRFIEFTFVFMCYSRTNGSEDKNGTYRCIAKCFEHKWFNIILLKPIVVSKENIPQFTVS